MAVAGKQLLRTGDVLAGKYRIVRELASGAMGVVYLAQHVALGRELAIKTLRAELLHEADLAARFEQEARAASSIGDPHIVEVFDLGRTADGGCFMVMELLHGRSLADILAVEPVLSVARSVDLVAQTLAGLAAAHRHHIVHRDLKPENIFVVETEARPSFVKLLDFGISKVLEAGPTARMQRGTVDGTVLGTPEYMSPEQARGQIELVDARTDLYAAGVVLYEMLCGRTPHRGENYNAVLTSILTGGYPTARSLRPDLPAGLDAVLSRALAAERSARFPSATTMRAALLGALGSMPATEPPAATQLARVEVRRAAPSLPPLPPSPPPPPVPRLPSGAGPPSLQLVDGAGDNLAALDEPLTVDEIHDAPTARVPSTVPPVPTPRLELAARPVRRSLAPRRPPAPPARLRAGTWRKLGVGVLVALVASAALITYRALQRSDAGPAEVPYVVDLWPENADLLVDGRAASGRTLQLTAGSHLLAASAPGYLPRRLAIIVHGDAGHLPLRLGHRLVTLSPRDPGVAVGFADHPVIPADLDAKFAKIDGYQQCLAASEEMHRLRERLLAARAANREPLFVALDEKLVRGCVTTVSSDKSRVLPALDDAANVLGRALDELLVLFYSPSAERELMAKLNAFVGLDEVFRRELFAARAVVEEAELALLGADGRTSVWYMRRYALTAEAWLAAGLLSGFAPATTAPRAAALAAAQRDLLARLDDRPAEAAGITGKETFLAAATAVAAASVASPPPSRAAAIEAVNQLLRAFDALVTD